MKYKKSPLYRTGNKYKNLKKIIQLFPENINNFYDLFGGSGVVVINANAKQKYYNELDSLTYNIVDYIKTNRNVINDYKSFKEEHYKNNDKDFFERTKRIYNANRRIEHLWYLSFMSLSNDLRFNNKGEINIPFGERYSEEKLFEVKNFENIFISNEDYLEFYQTITFHENDFIFLDPPYLQSADTNKSTYTDSWSLEQENKLLQMCEELIKKEIKFMITNTVRSKGVENKKLLDFIKKHNLNTVVLNETNNANGQINTDYLEVAIFNYEPKFNQTSLF